MEAINHIIRKSKVCLVFILMCTMAIPQENSNSNGLEYDYFSISPVEGYVSENNVGMSISSSLGFSYNNHLFSLNASAGSDLVIFGISATNYQINLLYGREFKLSRIIYTDTHIGAGIYGVNDHRDFKLTRAGLPIVTKLRFKTGDRFSVGLKFQANLNAIQNNMAFGIVLQWNSD